MRCCASPTTSIAPNDAAPRSPRNVIAAEFEVLLLASAFKPLAKALGFYGDLIVSETARTFLRAWAEEPAREGGRGAGGTRL